MNYTSKIRVVEGFPTEGISFKDITTLLKDGPAFKQLIDEMAAEINTLKPDLIIGPEARGFVIGCPIAYALGLGFVPVRKPGKLPAETYRYEYQLEYGVDVLEAHKDAIQKGQRVVVVDDLLATGGTAFATAKLVESMGGEVVALRFVMELSDLKGREALAGYNVDAVVKY